MVGLYNCISDVMTFCMTLSLKSGIRLQMNSRVVFTFLSPEKEVRMQVD